MTTDDAVEIRLGLKVLDKAADRVYCVIVYISGRKQVPRTARRDVIFC